MREIPDKYKDSAVGKALKEAQEAFLKASCNRPGMETLDTAPQDEQDKASEADIKEYLDWIRSQIIFEQRNDDERASIHVSARSFFSFAVQNLEHSFKPTSTTLYR